MTNQPLHPDVIEFLDEKSLLKAYQQMDGQPGHPAADELFVEIERRNLEI